MAVNYPGLFVQKRELKIKAKKKPVMISSYNQFVGPVNKNNSLTNNMYII
jgi:hypothetical protein